MMHCIIHMRDDKLIGCQSRSHNIVSYNMLLLHCTEFNSRSAMISGEISAGILNHVVWSARHSGNINDQHYFNSLALGDVIVV